MSRYTGPKNRVCRRFGANLFGKARNPLLHKPNPPGVHGARRRKKSDYAIQLEEKQKLTALYGMISRKQMLRYYKEATHASENTPEAFVQNLETRLDVLVHRLGFAKTIFHAHQIVAHGHVMVDGRRVDIRSFHVKPGSTISIREKSRNNLLIKEALDHATKQDLPEYLSLDAPKFSGKLETLPHIDQIPHPIQVNVPVVCEFLAHTA
jgi:small subunit ribosomal protein S4